MGAENREAKKWQKRKRDFVWIDRLRWNDENFLSQNCNIFSVSSIFK